MNSVNFTGSIVDKIIISVKINSNLKIQDAILKKIQDAIHKF